MNEVRSVYDSLFGVFAFQFSTQIEIIGTNFCIVCESENALNSTPAHPKRLASLNPSCCWRIAEAEASAAAKNG
jgi:hypothetical protein